MSDSKNKIREQLYYGEQKGYSHMIVVLSSFDYTNFCVYVKKGESLDNVVSRYNNLSSTYKVMEIYNYEMNLEHQLAEYGNTNTNIKKIESSLKNNMNEQNKGCNFFPGKYMIISQMARKYATIKHKGQKRKTGEDYIVHPIAVAELLLKFKQSKNIDRLLAAAYLHDILEDTDTTYYELVEIFGYDIASIVMELTTDEDMKKAIGKSQYLAYKLKNMTSWALAIKLCDRLNNVSDLETADEAFRNKYINETIFILDYIVQNRKLSSTHLEIIKAINLKLSTLTNTQAKKPITLVLE